MSIKKFPLEAYGAAVSREELVQAALDEITKNYREASLSNVARSYGVSLAYVSECVRAQTGRTYKELLQKHRMETAARLLRRSDWNIQQIITYVGYENTSYFYRLFHERYGQSPREYRQSRAARTRTPADAARLLRRSDWNIQQIITYVGYENTSYFYRLFHERYGQSPREYRQSRAARTRTPA